jgi:hypothetical protein
MAWLACGALCIDKEQKAFPGTPFNQGSKGCANQPKMQHVSLEAFSCNCYNEFAAKAITRNCKLLLIYPSTNEIVSAVASLDLKSVPYAARPKHPESHPAH